jgi:hypothetical protein
MSAKSDGYFKVYEEHMKTLRAWFVAYGIGGPVLFVTQKEFAATVISSGNSRLIGVLFLLGVLFQVLIALLNKWVNWGLYYYEEFPDLNRGKIHDFCESVSGMVFIDILADVATLVLFSWATVVVLMVVGRIAGIA